MSNLKRDNFVTYKLLFNKKVIYYSGIHNAKIPLSVTSVHIPPISRKPLKGTTSTFVRGNQGLMGK